MRLFLFYYLRVSIQEIDVTIQMKMKKCFCVFCHMFKPYCDRLHEYQALKASAKEKNYPNELIKSSKTKFMSIVNTINKNKIELLTLLGIPEHAVTKFRAAIFSQSVTASRFDIDLSPDKANSIQGLGYVKIEGNNAKVAYAEAHTTAELIEQFEPVVYTDNGRQVSKRARGFTLKELQIINKELKERAGKDLQERIKTIKELQH